VPERIRGHAPAHAVQAASPRRVRYCIRGRDASRQALAPLPQLAASGCRRRISLLLVCRFVLLSHRRSDMAAIAYRDAFDSRGGTSASAKVCTV
jgi:hypothetical protein